MKKFSAEIFAERLKSLREEKGLSQIQLSKEINVSNVAIFHWENCKRIPSIENLFNLAIFFDVTADYLLGLEN